MEAAAAAGVFLALTADVAITAVVEVVRIVRERRGGPQATPPGDEDAKQQPQATPPGDENAKQQPQYGMCYRNETQPPTKPQQCPAARQAAQGGGDNPPPPPPPLPPHQHAVCFLNGTEVCPASNLVGWRQRRQGTAGTAEWDQVWRGGVGMLVLTVGLGLAAVAVRATRRTQGGAGRHRHPAPAAVDFLQQPQRAALLARERPIVPDHERISCAFAEIDEGNKGFVTLDEFERGFRTRGIDFSANTVQELFAKGDANQDQRIDRHEWWQFAIIYPNTVDAVYYHGRDLSTEQARRDSVAALQRDLDLGRQRESELRATADAQAQQNQAIARQLQEQEQQLRDGSERRNTLGQQQFQLIEKEFKPQSGVCVIPLMRT